MGIFSGFYEEEKITEIIESNDLVGTKIYFDDSVIYTDENGEEHQLEYCIKRNDFSSTVISINGEVRKINECNIAVIALAYLKVQDYERNYKS